MTRLPSCPICARHLLPGQSMQDHYRTSTYHPHCTQCDTSFSKLQAFITHKPHCFGLSQTGGDLKSTKRRRSRKRKVSLMRRLVDLGVLPGADGQYPADNIYWPPSSHSGPDTENPAEPCVEEQSTADSVPSASPCTTVVSIDWSDAPVVERPFEETAPGHTMVDLHLPVTKSNRAANEESSSLVKPVHREYRHSPRCSQQER
ncbi:hypothetical protein L227DRAFT_241861 [Lentinus tigrinus ALCF2SS1-6]|uniref:Uncharacterized protein n=1 Tax=Lentinus tigrinus ALCF2SS1-6 TaxID=1328759 RepID=A0A5C2S0J7_9APHY|nr:hypothetical protein L227DRAFT_241861 [Lentinus tigrinus ALCF2SS1-6]